MAALTPAQFGHLAVTTLINYQRGPSIEQERQKMPTYDHFMRKKKEKPFTEAKVSLLIRGRDDPVGEGWEGNDALTFNNPTNGVRAVFPRYLMHAGLTVNYDEMLRNGLGLGNSSKLQTPLELAGSDMHRLANLFDEKNSQFMRGHLERQARLLWRDGTADTKSFAGILAFISTTPAVGTVGGIDRSVAANAYWRNRTAPPVTPSLTAQPMIDLLEEEILQLQRYGGNPTLAPCGSFFLNTIKRELKQKGYYTQNGFSPEGIELGVADPSMKGIKFYYEPYLDTEGYSRRCYLIDPENLYFAHDPGEFERIHTPDRSHEIMSVFMSLTTSGGLCMEMGNCHGVYSYA